MRSVRNDPELQGLVQRFVTPDRRYLRLGGGLLRLNDAERSGFAKKLARAAFEITPVELSTLFEGGWRERKVASWLVAVAHRTEFRDRIGQLLLASEGPHAGAAYCITLAKFGARQDRELLCDYLDHYLSRPDLDYDQGLALAALLHLDDVLGSGYSSRFLAPSGLWYRWVAGRAGRDTDPQGYRRILYQLRAFADECTQFFAQL
ncbi:DUF6000 family protein [Nocardia sp. NPDC050799]|uniref:DUF6000 family protein n=1 Tax=Nocardia sp. NPDC050799 TaxID=3154842 RepID=UPI0033E5B140